MKPLEFGLAVAVIQLATMGHTSLGETSESSERIVPLSSVVTTGPQKGMEPANNVFRQEDGKRDNKAYYNYIGKIEQNTHSGASNAFLIDATTVQDAVRASTRILLGSRAARTPAAVNTVHPIRGSHWLVAYLGTGPSDPTWWTVESIKVKDKTIRLAFRESPPTGATRDGLLYYYWAPLGTLNPGTYDIELFDLDRTTISLMRKVEVE